MYVVDGKMYIYGSHLYVPAVVKSMQSSSLIVLALEQIKCLTNFKGLICFNLSLIQNAGLTK